MEMEETRRLIARSQQGEKEARDLLVEKNLALVASIARRFLDRGLEYDDLVQIGSLGLLKAIDDFDLRYEVRFSTYAVPKIMGEIRQHLRKSSLIQVGRPLKALASRAIGLKDNLTQELGRTPTISELAARLKVSPEELVTALDAVSSVLSLQEKIEPGGGEQASEFQDFLACDPDQENFLLKEALRNLDPQARQVILLRYFAEKSQSEVGAALGISQAQVSRMEARIVRELRREI